MSRLDYSKWDHIEVSDDEDDTHPNVDTPSLFKWRHEARVQRMAEAEHEKQQFNEGYTDHQQKMTQLKQRLKEAESDSRLVGGMDKLKLEMKELEDQEEKWRKKEEELKKKEKLAPQNIDTLCHDGKSKTIINKSTVAPKKTEEEEASNMIDFIKKNKKTIEKFGMLRRYEDSEAFLKETPHLVCESTANHLVMWCIDLQLEEKTDLMNHVSHQTIVMQFILELAKSLEIDPRGCVSAFFSRIKMAEKQYMDAFNDELTSFRLRVKARAEEKLEKAMKELEKEQRLERLGPGGLDPVEVFKTLPESLKKCFDKKDIPLLQKAIEELPEEDAKYHMKRCVDSGLWVPESSGK